jgi:hypothetical protein
MAGWGLFAGALMYCLLVFAGVATYSPDHSASPMADGAAYYFTETPYDWSDDPAFVGEYLYSPAFLWVVAPLQLLPWELFATVWFGLHLAVLLYLRVPWMLAFVPVMDDALWGNIYTFLALAVVLVVRHGVASLWVTVLLTKVTPAVGMGWHLGRREWRGFATALVVTAFIVGVGVVANPELWEEWFAALRGAPGSYPGIGDSTIFLIVRMAIGGLVSVFAGATNRTWLLPIGMLAAVPGFFIYSFALLLASVVLYLDGRATRLAPAAARAVATDEPRAPASGSSTAASTG